MDAVATWTDGPEYAPVVRPEVFVAPDVSPLSVAEPDPTTTVGAGDPPTDFAVATGAVALDTIGMRPTDTRDPQAPFDVVSTPLTSWAPPPSEEHATGRPFGAPSGHAPPPVMGPAGYPVPAPSSAWGAAHVPGVPSAAPGWPPPPPAVGQQPGMPHPAAGWPPPSGVPQPPVAPGSWPPPTHPRPGPVAATEVVRAVTPGVLICLVVGTLIPPLSLPLLWVAQALGTRIQYLRPQTARWFGMASIAVVVLGLVGMFFDYGSFDIIAWYQACLVWAQGANAVMAAWLFIAVGSALRRGDRPGT